MVQHQKIYSLGKYFDVDFLVLVFKGFHRDSIDLLDKLDDLFRETERDGFHGFSFETHHG
jgi:hypothetical protein